jgi:hypothetical protein
LHRAQIAGTVIYDNCLLHKEILGHAYAMSGRNWQYLSDII